MAFSLSPQNRVFFDLLSRSAANAVKGAEALRELATDYNDVARRAKIVKDREHDGDAITHEIMNALSTSYITPYDREDLYALASAIDDVLDYAEEVADTMVLYRIQAPTQNFIELVDVLVLAGRELVHAVDKLESKKDISPHWIEVNTLENEGDRLHRKAISSLFDSESDPLTIIKWKDVYRLVESAIDKCEDAANVIENMVIKHG